MLSWNAGMVVGEARQLEKLVFLVLTPPFAPARSARIQRPQYSKIKPKLHALECCYKPTIVGRLLPAQTDPERDLLSVMEVFIPFVPLQMTDLDLMEVIAPLLQ